MILAESETDDKRRLRHASGLVHWPIRRFRRVFFFCQGERLRRRDGPLEGCAAFLPEGSDGDVETGLYRLHTAAMIGEVRYCYGVGT